MAEGSNRALVVDDDQAIRSVLFEALSDEGYDVRAAGDGLEAIKLLEVWRPDVILLDLMMPVMDGWAFRSQQRALHGAADIPVIILSAARDLAQQANILDASAAFAKPFDLDPLLDEVKRVLTTTPPTGNHA